MNLSPKVKEIAEIQDDLTDMQSALTVKYETLSMEELQEYAKWFMTESKAMKIKPMIMDTNFMNKMFNDLSDYAGLNNKNV